MTQELKFKIIIIGDSGVGKTSMLLKYVDDYFPETHIATIGVEYKTKTLIKGKYKISLNIWDTAGQERFKSITKTFFNNTTGALFVYDITKRSSFSGPTGVKTWIKDSQEYHKFDSIIVGNKIDLVKREVQFSELKELGVKNKMDFFETSAKTGKNINEVFDKLVDNIIKNRSEEELIKEFGIKSNSKNKKLSKKNDNKKKACCKWIVKNLINLEIDSIKKFIKGH